MVGLSNWLKTRFPEAENIGISYEGADHVPFPDVIKLISAAILNSSNGEDCVFVVPQAETVAYLSAIFSSLFFTKQNFDEWREDFAKEGLRVGERIKLIPDDTIYEYGGYIEGGGKQFFRLKLLSKKANGGSTSLPLEEILRLFPTDRTTPYGGPDTKGSPILSDLDKVLDIKSFGNYALFKNRVILHRSKTNFDSFMQSWSIHRYNNYCSPSIASLNDMIDLPWGTIDSSGKLQSFNRYQTYGEPIISLCRRLSPIDEYCKSKKDDDCSIITSDKKAVFQNAYEVSNLCEHQKLFLITDSLDLAEANELKDLGFKIWDFNKEEIFIGISSDTDIVRAKSFLPLRMMYGAAEDEKSDVKIHEVSSELLEKISNNISEANRSVDLPDISEKTVQPIKRIYWRCLELFGLPGKQYQDWLLGQLSDVEETVSRQKSFIGSEASEMIRLLVSTIVDDLLPNIQRHSAQKLEKIDQLASDFSNSKVLILCRHVEAKYILKEHFGHYEHFTFITYNDIQAIKTVYDVAISVGWPGKFIFQKLLSSGVSDKIEMVLYTDELLALNAFFKAKEKTEREIMMLPSEKAEIVGCPVSLMDEIVAKKTDDIKPISSVSENEMENSSKHKLLFDIDWSFKPPIPTGSAGDVMVETIYVSFSNDNCGYFNLGRSVAVINPGSQTYRRKTPDTLMPGDIVVFRESGEREILKEIAEKVYSEDYEILWNTATMWKQWLNSLGSEPREVRASLLKNGLNRNQLTIINWIKDSELIGPQNLNDILVIAKATGNPENEELCPKIAGAIKLLRGLHVEAGFKLTKIMMNRLSQEIDSFSEEVDRLSTDLGDVELMVVEDVDEKPVMVPASLSNIPKPIWWFNYYSKSSDEILDELLSGRI